MLLSEIALALSALAAANLPDPAATFVPSRDFAPSSVSFNDKEGKGFEWSKRLPCGANRATVTVRFDEGYPRYPQTSLGKIWLHSGNKGSESERWMAASILSPTDRWKLNGLAWLERATSTDREALGGYGPVELNKPLRIDFAWTPEGVVNVSFGGEFAKHGTMSGAITEIGVGGSLAKFAFLNLTVGRSGNPDPACELPEIASTGIQPPSIAVPAPVKRVQ